MNYNSILLSCDSYKTSHYLQYPPGTEYVFSYIESRGGKFDKTVVFGLQIFLKEYLTKPITQSDIDEAEEVWTAHAVPFNRAGWQYILDNHAGYLPVSIKAVPEGTVIDSKNVLVTIVNTDPNCPWLTSYLETSLLRAVWYPVTVASLSWKCKQIIKEAIAKSSDVPEQIAFKLHDFGARGVSSMESAGIGGAAHLVNFMGSDTFTGVMYARKYYNEPMAAYSIPAAEHSTITSWGRDCEVEAYRNMLKQFAKPGSLVAVVSDSYDLDNAVRHLWGEKLKDEVVASGATVIIRPDSGNPLTIPVETVRNLASRFGCTTNSKGYKVLNTVRVIQGDGIDADSLPKIIDNLLNDGWAIDNLAFGMGGGLLQQVNRDTNRFAMKCSAIYLNGVWRDVFKNPVTDPGKTSKAGRLGLTKVDGKFTTVPVDSINYVLENEQLKEVFRDGNLLIDYTFTEIRDRANAG